jgi:hypothetical protein
MPRTPYLVTSKWKWWRQMKPYCHLLLVAAEAASAGIMGYASKRTAFSFSALNNTTMMMMHATSSSLSRAQEGKGSFRCDCRPCRTCGARGDGGDIWEGTIGYTDDSDLRLMVLHAGFVTLDDMRAAKLGLPSPCVSIGSHHASRSVQRPSAKEWDLLFWLPLNRLP